MKLALSQIRLDGGTQSRAALNEQAISDYCEAMGDGEDFPPVVVFHDGQAYWLADGFHRVRAAERACLAEIDADVRQGSRRDAVLYSLGANRDHGLRRTNEDKRRSVRVMLEDAEWSKWSDREIARQVGVSNNFVSVARRSLSSNDSGTPRTYTTKHGTVATMNTAAIGARPAAEKPAPAPAAAPIRESVDTDSRIAAKPSAFDAKEHARLEAMARGEAAEAVEEEVEEPDEPAEFNADVAALNLYGVISAAVKAWPATESLKPLISTMRQVLGHLERAEKERSNG